MSRYNTLLDQNKGYDVGGPAPLNGYDMRSGVPLSYDDLRLKPQGCSDWRQPPANVPLQKGKFFVTQGFGVPLRNEATFTALPENSMFIFDKNVSSPACCPADFSTSTGCVCTTPQQRYQIGVARGGNSTFPTNPPI